MPARPRSRSKATLQKVSLRGVRRALIIQEPWLGEILAGRKTWELRTRLTHVRGPVGLIRSGSGRIFGIARLTNSLPKLSKAQMLRTIEKHRVPRAQAEAAYDAGWRTPWVLEGVQVFSRPRRYKHPSGAVTWVTLDRAA